MKLLTGIASGLAATTNLDNNTVVQNTNPILFNNNTSDNMLSNSSLNLGSITDNNTDSTILLLDGRNKVSEDKNALMQKFLFIYFGAFGAFVIVDNSITEDQGQVLKQKVKNLFHKNGERSIKTKVKKADDLEGQINNKKVIKGDAQDDNQDDNYAQIDQGQLEHGNQLSIFEYRMIEQSQLDNSISQYEIIKLDQLDHEDQIIELGSNEQYSNPDSDNYFSCN